MPGFPLLPYEDPATLSAAVAYRWKAIHRQMLLVGEAQERRLSSAGASAEATAALRTVEARMRHQRARVDFWRARAWRLQGLDLDVDRRLLTIGGVGVRLSAREGELLNLLLGSPDRVFSPRELLAEAWKNPFVSEQGLRNYLPRIRRKLATLGIADIANLAGRGYVLKFRDLDTSASARGLDSEHGWPRIDPSQDRARQTAAATSVGGLLPSEELASPDAAEALCWAGIYDQLGALTAAHLKAARAAGATAEEQASQRPDIAAIEDSLRGQEQRRDHWHQRHWELCGLCIDDDSRTLSYRGQERRLTRREHQLLRYMEGAPSQFIPAQRIINGAWPDARATIDELRNYVRRLRVLLAQMAIPCQIQNRPGLGYAVVMGPPEGGAGSFPD